jgi:hypothetical protein
VDGLSCERNPRTGAYHCHNSNRDDEHGKKVFAFHSNDYCVKTDLDHSWIGVHREANFSSPNETLASTPDDGFVLQNDSTNQPDAGAETRTDDETMSFYNEQDLGFTIPWRRPSRSTIAISVPCWDLPFPIVPI